MKTYTIKVLENRFGSGNGFNNKPIFEFTGDIKKFNLNAFEKRLRKLNIEHKLFNLMAWSLMYGYSIRVLLSF